MARVAVFAGPSLLRNLERAQGRGLVYEFLPLRSLTRPPLARSGYAAALVELGGRLSAATLRGLRKALAGRPLGSLSARSTPALLRRSVALGFEFHLSSGRPGDPAAQEVLARIGAARGGGRGDAGDQAQALRVTSKRLSILTDVVKTANSILEPRKVIELVWRRSASSSRPRRGRS
jgi:hypothetical protein